MITCSRMWFFQERNGCVIWTGGIRKIDDGLLQNWSYCLWGLIETVTSRPSLAPSLPSGGCLLCIWPLLTAKPSTGKKGLQIHPSVGLHLSCALTVKIWQWKRDRQTASALGGGGVKPPFLFQQNNGNADEDHWTHTNNTEWLIHVHLRCGDNVQAHTHTCFVCIVSSSETRHQRKNAGVSLVMFWVRITTTDKDLVSEDKREETSRGMWAWWFINGLGNSPLIKKKSQWTLSYNSIGPFLGWKKVKLLLFYLFNMRNTRLSFAHFHCFLKV